MFNRKDTPSKIDMSSRYARAKRYGRKTITILTIVLIVLVAIGLCGFRFAYNEMLPNVIEMTEREATTLLEDNDMKVQVQRDWSDKFEEGIVISQDPKGGAQSLSGATVTIVISKGPKSVSMADFTGRSKDEAITTLSKSNVSWICSEVYSDEVEAGNIIDQSPAAGEEVLMGENVLLVVSKGAKASVRTGDDIEVTKKKNSDRADKNKSKTSNDIDSDDTTESNNSISHSTNNNSSGSNSLNGMPGTSKSSSDTSDSSGASQDNTNASSGSSQSSSDSSSGGSSNRPANTDSGSSTSSGTDSTSGIDDSSGTTESGDPETDSRIETGE